MASSANLPAPYLGVDESVPKAVVKSPYCENLLNFNTTQAGITLRNGDSKYRLVANMVGLDSQVALRLFQYGNEKSLVLFNDDIAGEIVLYDVDANTVVGGIAKAATGYIDLYDVYFNKYLFFFTTDLNIWINHKRMNYRNF